MLKRSVFILLLLLFFALPLFSQDYISVPRVTLEKLLALEMSTQTKIDLLENELQKAKKELSISKNQTAELKLYITELEQALTELDKIHEQELKSLIASSQAKQIKTGFIVGGVCITVGVGIGIGIGFYISDKISK